MARVVNADLLKNYMEKAPIKILNLKELVFLGGGKYSNLSYCKEILDNSKGNRGFHSESTKQDSYEELVRMFILTKLCNELGYSPNDIEIERKFESGSKSSGNDYLDICVYRKNDKTKIFLAIELKKPEEFDSLEENSIQNQLFKLAAMATQESPKVEVENLVYYTVETINSDFVERIKIIDYKTFDTYASYLDKKNQGIHFDGDIPKNYGVVKKTTYANVTSVGNGKQPLIDVIDSEKSRILAQTLHNTLWGGGSTTDNDIFNFLTKLLLTKIYDEESTPLNEDYAFQLKVKTDSSGKDIIETVEDLYDRLNKLYLNALRERMFIDKNVEPFMRPEYMQKLKQIVLILQSYSFTKSKEINNGVDILGQFFETIVNKDFKQSKGQFFTPTEIVKFMVNALKIDEIIDKKMEDNTLPYIIDPSCGSGTFLIEYMKYVSEYLRQTYFGNISNLSIAKRNKLMEFIGVNGDKNTWASKFIYGTEVSPDLGTAVKVNMILHGDGASNVFCGVDKGDGLLPFGTYKKPNGEDSTLNYSTNSNDYYNHEVNEKFDVILSNPPFSVILADNTQEHLSNNFDIKYLAGKIKNSENVFIERYYQLLKEHGRMAIVLPESCFDGKNSLDMRLFLYKYFNVKAIVSLPITAFSPFTETKTSILFAEKKSSDEMSVWSKIESDLIAKYPKISKIKLYSEIFKVLPNNTMIVSVDDVGDIKKKQSVIKRPNELYSPNDIKEIVFKDMDDNYAIKDLREVVWGDVK